MAKRKGQDKYLEFRKSFQRHQGEFRAIIGMPEPEPQDLIRGYPYGKRHADPKEAERRLDEAMKWL